MQETAAWGTQVLPTRAPPVPGVPGSPCPLPQGVFLSLGRTQAAQPPGIPRASSQHGGASAAPRHAYLALDQLHHFGCRGKSPHESPQNPMEKDPRRSTELAAERGARLLFIETGRSAAGRGGRSRAAGTRSLASRARQGSAADHAQTTPPRGGAVS